MRRKKRMEDRRGEFGRGGLLIPSFADRSVKSVAESLSMMWGGLFDKRDRGMVRRFQLGGPATGLHQDVSGNN